MAGQCRRGQCRDATYSGHVGLVGRLGFLEQAAQHVGTAEQHVDVGRGGDQFAIAEQVEHVLHVVGECGDRIESQESGCAFRGVNRRERRY